MPLRLIVPASINTPTAASVRGISALMMAAAARRPPSRLYLLKLDQPAISSPTTVSPVIAKK
jgi:hypothetical protein